MLNHRTAGGGHAPLYPHWVRKKKKKTGAGHKSNDSFQVYKMFAIHVAVTPSHKAWDMCSINGSKLIHPLFKDHAFKFIVFIRTRFNNN